MSEIVELNLKYRVNEMAVGTSIDLRIRKGNVIDRNIYEITN